MLPPVGCVKRHLGFRCLADDLLDVQIIYWADKPTLSASFKNGFAFTLKQDQGAFTVRSARAIWFNFAGIRQGHWTSVDCAGVNAAHSKCGGQTIRNYVWHKSEVCGVV